MEQLTLSQTITQVEFLINTGAGDPGRLFHILEFLKRGKPLFNSDQIYLEGKLQAKFSTEEEEEEPEVENPLLPQVQELINAGAGDPGRLQYIFDRLAQNRTLFNSDQNYLDSKLDSFYNKPKESDLELNYTSSTVESTSTKTIEQSKPTQPELQQNSSRATPSPPSPKGAMPKGWSATNSEEINKISQDIKSEEQKIEQQQKISSEIDEHRLKTYQIDFP